MRRAELGKEGVQSEDRFEELLGSLLDDELSSEELSELMQLAQENPSRREEIRRQLESAEMIALSEDELRDASLFVSAIHGRIGEDPFVSQVQSAIRGGQGGARRAILPWIIASVAILVLAFIVLSQPGTEVPSNAGAQVPAPIARIAELTGSMTWIGDRGQVDDNPETEERATAFYFQRDDDSSFRQLMQKVRGLLEGRKVESRRKM